MFLLSIMHGHCEYILLTGIVLVLYFNLPILAFEPPKITSIRNEMVLQSGQNSRIQCQGQQPLKWRLPNIPVAVRHWTPITAHKRKVTLNNTVMYYSVLYISNASYPWTGFYFCEYCTLYINEKKEVLHSRFAKIYVYVFDGRHLSASTSRALMVDITSKSSIQLPCRPTLPNVTVSLHCADYRGHSGVCKEAFKATFEPKVGYVLHDFNGYFFLCTFRFENITVTDLIILGQPDDRRMFIRGMENTNGTFYVHKNLSICISPDAKVSFYSNAVHWLLPNNEGIANYYTMDQTRRVNIFSVDLKLRSDYPPQIDENIAQYECQWFQLKALNKRRTFTSDTGTYITYMISKTGMPTYAELNIQILDNIQYHFMQLSPIADICSIVQESTGTTTSELIFKINAYPNILIVWLNNHDETIHNNNTKYYVNTNTTHTILSIFNSTHNDSGLYKVRASHIDIEKEFSIPLNIVTKPLVNVDLMNRHHIAHLNYTVKCIVSGSPPSEIDWYFIPFSCLQDVNCKSYEQLQENTEFITSTVQECVTHIQAKESGTIICKAKNYYGTSENSTRFTVAERKNVIHIRSSKPVRNLSSTSYELTLIEHEVLSLECSASIYLEVRQLYWQNNENRHQFVFDRRFSIRSQRNNLEVSHILTIEDLAVNDTGIYKCHICLQDDINLEETVYLKVHKRTKPQLFTNRNTSMLEIKLAHSLDLHCETIGWPKPKLAWLKDGNLLKNSSHYQFRNNSQNLYFISVLDEDSGNYTCQASNEMGQTSKSILLTVMNQSIRGKSLFLWIGITVAVVLSSITLILYYCLKISKSSKLKREIDELNLRQFGTGAPECLNPDLELNVQAEFLPYDSRWNFPKENLRLGRKLGSGAFGIVVEAEAVRILSDERWTKVAVKMVKSNSDKTHLRSLISELKILNHVGQHINIVNLLGACTENICRKELLVIFEYCTFGSVLKFLQNNRSKFIDLIDRKTNEIRGGKYLNGTNLSENEADVCLYKKPEYIMFSHVVNGTVTNERSLDTKDLIEWSYQVARGMEFLSGKNILHGDLAARNILLTDNNLVKICDFGLSKNLYNYAKYNKKGKEVLPIKWLAIETLENNTFSTQSDVWSFGIVLWEFFSMGMTPYPGMAAGEFLLRKLKNGYRMTCPTYATSSLYTIMKNCWTPSPHCRPDFRVLSENLYNILDAIENSKEEYTQYWHINEGYFQDD